MWRTVILIVVLMKPAHALDLRWNEAQDLFVQRSLTARSAKALVTLREQEYRSLYSTWLPKLAVGRDFTFFDATAREDANWQATNRLSLGMSIPNPLLFGSRLEQADLARQFVDISYHERIEELRHQARLIYFRAKKSQQGVQNAKMLLSLARRLLQGAELRHQQGFVSRSEVDRLKLQVLNLELAQERSQEMVKADLATLAVQIGLDARVSLKLLSSLRMRVTEEPTYSSIFKLLEDKTSSYAIAKAEIGAQQASSQVESFSYRFLPDLAVSAGLAWQRAGQGHQLDYKVSLSWTLFDGATRYFERRQDLTKQAIAKLDVEIAHHDQKLRRIKLLHDFRATQASYQQQSLIVELSSSLVAASEKNFQNGTIQSKQVSDDISAYIRQLDKLNQLSYEFVILLSDITRETKNASLFSKNFPF